MHKILFEHFGVENEFSTEDAAKLLDISVTEFCRDVRTAARKRAIDDLRGYYLACLSNDARRMIFTRNPEHITSQFKKDRGNHHGKTETFIVLAAIAHDVGMTDPVIDAAWWEDAFRNVVLRLQNKGLALENERRELEKEKERLRQAA